MKTLVAYFSASGIAAKVAETQNNKMKSLFAKLETTMEELKIPDDVEMYESEDFDVEEDTA